MFAIPAGERLSIFSRKKGKYFNTSKKLSEWVMHLDDCPTCELHHLCLYFSGVVCLQN